MALQYASAINASAAQQCAVGLANKLPEEASVADLIGRLAHLADNADKTSDRLRGVRDRLQGESLNTVCGSAAPAAGEGVIYDFEMAIRRLSSVLSSIEASASAIERRLG